MRRAFVRGRIANCSPEIIIRPRNQRGIPCPGLVLTSEKGEGEPLSSRRSSSVNSLFRVHLLGVSSRTKAWLEGIHTCVCVCRDAWRALCARLPFVFLAEREEEGTVFGCASAIFLSAPLFTIKLVKMIS